MMFFFQSFNQIKSEFGKQTQNLCDKIIKTADCIYIKVQVHKYAVSLFLKTLPMIY